VRIYQGPGSMLSPVWARNPVNESGPVLDPLEPVLHVGPGALSRFVIVHGSLHKRLLARRLSAGRACSGWSSGSGGCGHAIRREGRRRGHLPRMTALTTVSEGELWTSFPEATRNDVLGLLSMLLERLAVSPMPAAEGSGGEDGAGG
jgi:hypothetical protein